MQPEDWRHLPREHPEVETLIRVDLRIESHERPARLLEREKLAVRAVSKQFRVRGGHVDALSDVSLSVMEGEFVCLVGPSGCGKSTLLSIIAGLERPTAGEVVADGRLVQGPGPERIVMFQEPALFPWLTVAQNVEFGLRLRGIAREVRALRTLEGLRQVSLAEFADSYVHQLSGGMKQRAALARALVLDPSLLLLDEPFAALDAQSRDLLHEELLGVWARTGKTIVFVTHNVQEALRLADRIVVFSARPGRVIKEFPVTVPRPRPVEQGALCEVDEAIRCELRQALTTSQEGGIPRARRLTEDRFLSRADCSMGTDR